ncbi:MAG: trigger factor [Chloroflexi bacterium]|nr:trigger factor [Chloroflexota bacterium]
MTLIINTEEDEQRQLTLTIEVPEKRVLQEMKAKARKLARDINVPGFRRGKAPYHVIVNRVGKDHLRGEAIEALIQPVYEEALAEVEPDIYAQASLDKIEDEPLTLTFTLPLTPEVDLGDYRSLRKEIDEVEISDEAVAEALEAAQERYAELEEVDRPAEEGDVVTIAGKGIVPAEEVAEAELEEDEVEETAAANTADAESETEDEAEDTDGEAEDEEEAAAEEIVLFDTESLQIILDSDKVFPGTSFAENIVGMSPGDEKSFSFTFPDDFEEEELQGREATVELTLLQVENRLVPLLDDNLAELEGYETLDDMKEGVREDLEKAAKEQARNELMDEMVNDIREIATLVYPPAAVNEELDNRIAQFKRQVEQAEWEWDDYLKLQGTTEEKLRENFKEGAVKAVETQLILRQFVLDEKITIKEADVDAKIDERTESYGDNEELAAAIGEYYKQGPGLDMISSEILTDKAYERMVAILSGNAPDLAELEAEAEEEAEEEAAAEIEAVEEAAEEELIEEVAAEMTEEMAEAEEDVVVAEAAEATAAAEVVEEMDEETAVEEQE